MAAVDLVAAIVAGVLWFLSGFFVLVVLALCTPLRLSASAYGIDISEAEGIWPDGFRWRLRMAWLLGLLQLDARQDMGEPVRRRVTLFGIPVRTAPKVSSEKRSARVGVAGGAGEKKGSGGRKSQKAGSRRLAPHEIRSLLGEAGWFLRRLRRAARVHAAGDLVYGFSDPAVTGWCEGLRHTLNLPRQLRLTPSFEEGRLQGWLDVQLTVYPITCVWVVTRALFRKGVRRVWWPRLRRRLPWAGNQGKRRAAAATGRRRESQ